VGSAPQRDVHGLFHFGLEAAQNRLRLAMLTRGEQCGQRVGARPWAVRALAVGDHVPGVEEPAQDPVRTRFGDVGIAGDLAEAVRPARLAHRFEHTQGS